MTGKEMRLFTKIVQKLDEVETLFQALSQETRLELEKEFEGETLILLKKMQRNFSDMIKKGV